jgi:hypothetical protein
MVVVLGAVLVSPWYAITTTQQVTQTFSSKSTYTSQVAFASTSYETQLLYNLTSPATLSGSVFIFTTNDFYLRGNSTYYVNITCTPCASSTSTFFLSPSPPGGNTTLNAFTVGYDRTGHGNVPITVPKSGRYYIWLYLDLFNGGSGLPSVTIDNFVVSSGRIAESETLMQGFTRTLSNYTTTTMTESSTTAVSPATELGATPFGLIIVLLALLVVVAVLFDRRKAHKSE